MQVWSIFRHQHLFQAPMKGTDGSPIAVRFYPGGFEVRHNGKRIGDHLGAVELCGVLNYLDAEPLTR